MLFLFSQGRGENGAVFVIRWMPWRQTEWGHGYVKRGHLLISNLALQYCFINDFKHDFHYRCVLAEFDQSLCIHSLIAVPDKMMTSQINTGNNIRSALSPGNLFRSG